MNYKNPLIGLLGLTLAACASPRHEPPVACAKPSEAEVAALFEQWNDALQTGDPQQVVARYADRSLLLPTLSPIARYSAEQKVDYFAHFLPLGPRGRIVNRQIHTDCDSAVDSGEYVFTFADGKQVPARYTFTYARQAGQWWITSHHSSALPVLIQAPPAGQ